MTITRSVINVAVTAGVALAWAASCSALAKPVAHRNRDLF